MSNDIKRELYHLKKSALLIVFLGISLILLYVNRAESYERYERIQFQSAGATLYANLYYPNHEISFQAKSPLLIYAHGIGNTRDLDLRIPIEFTKRGFYVAAIDYQGHGESGGNIDNIDPETNIPALAQDCSRLLDALEELPFYSEKINISQLGLIGHSLGGFTILMTQALDSRFKATVALAPLVDPEGSNIPIGSGYPDYHPVNLLNESNSKNLLIISHEKDEALAHEKNAVVAQKLTNCELITITEPLIGGGHALLSNDVLIKSINWFETLFFNSDTKNGPIYISYYFNYIFIFLSFFALFLTTLTLISFLSRYFTSNNDTKQENPEKKKVSISKLRKIIQWAKITLFVGIFISIWLFFQYFFGLLGLFYASFVMFLIYIIGKLYKYYKITESEGKKFNLKEIMESEFERNAFLISLIATGYYIGTFILFSIAYPFAFVLPSSFFTVIAALTAFPLYFSIELLYRKVIYPKLYFIKEERKKSWIIVVLAIIIQILLLILTFSWAFIPAVLYTHLIFLASVIYNTAIYENTKSFSSIILSSFIIIFIFFGAVISQSLGIGSALHYFV